MNKLLTAKETLDLLEARAPRAWSKRVLLSFIADGIVIPYALEGSLIGRIPVLCLLDDERFAPADGEAFWEAVTQEWGFLAPKESDAENGKCKVTGYRWYAQQPFEPHPIGIGYFDLADEVDWELGSISIGSIFPNEVERSLFLPDDLMFNEGGKLAHPRFSWLEFEVELSSICFDGNVIEALLINGPEAKGATESQQMPKKGGRRGLQHGEAIARTALRLARLDDAELRRYTASSLALELGEAYKSVGETPPSSENLERYAQGLLRAVRN